MRQPATAAQLRQALRNQEFENIPMGKGQCPLMQAHVSIFPVRYALDESPQKGTHQGPNPLPRNWPAGTLPPLQSRSYTLRQLRDGWLYVWSGTDNTLHEYQVEGEMLTRHKWTDAQLHQDTRSNPGDTRPYLLYPRNSQLRIAFPPVQWTWRMCELMRSSATRQAQWMREVDLPGYCTRQATVLHAVVQPAHLPAARTCRHWQVPPGLQSSGSARYAAAWLRRPGAR